MIFEDGSLPIEEIGKLRIMKSVEIKGSGISVGMECLDREIFDFDKTYEKLGAIGVKWARCQTGWCRCEKEKGRYDFTWLDHIVDKLLEVGVQPWFNVSYGNKLYMPDAFGETAVGFIPLYYGDEVLQAWKNYVSALASHFSGRVKRWEIWNEPDCTPFWQPEKPDPLEYARFIRETAPCIRQAIPDAEIGGCNAGMFNIKYAPDFIESGIGQDIQFFCVHNYSIQPEKDFDASVNALRRLFAKNGGEHVKICQGEAGYASHFPDGHWMGVYKMDSEANQAKWLLRRYATDFSAGMEMSSFFQMVDMMGKPYQMGNIERKDPARHGFLNGLSYTPKMSYYAMAHEACIFDEDTVCTPLFAALDTYDAVARGTQVSRLFDIAVRTVTFTRKGYPLYLYYLPEDVQHGFAGLKNAGLKFLPGEAGKAICEPVLVNMLTGKVYKALESECHNSGIIKVKGLPLTDYPLVVTDREAISDRIE